MKYTKLNLKTKTKKQLINIIIRLQNKKTTRINLSNAFWNVVADGTQGMKRGE